MKAEQQGSDRIIRVTNLPETLDGSPLPEEITITISYKEHSSAWMGVTLDHVIMPRIVKALND